MLINLYKEVNGELRFVDYGIPRLRESYKKQGYFVPIRNTTDINGIIDEKVHEDPNTSIIHHIHRARFNLRGRINDLICKLIPERFLNN